MKPIKDKTVEEFLEEVGSSSPTPGGGAVAAVVGAMATSLTEMVINLTREKGIGIKRIGKRVREIRVRLLKLADDDSATFDMVMNAYRTPKADKKRAKNIQEALKKATVVPFKTAQLSKEVNNLAKEVLKLGNKNASSDAKVAIHLSHAAVKSALENVRINASLIKDEEFVKKIAKEIEKIKN